MTEEEMYTVKINVTGLEGRPHTSTSSSRVCSVSKRSRPVTVEVERAEMGREQMVTAMSE